MITNGCHAPSLLTPHPVTGVIDHRRRAIRGVCPASSSTELILWSACLPSVTRVGRRGRVEIPRHPDSHLPQPTLPSSGNEGGKRRQDELTPCAQSKTNFLPRGQ